MLLAPIICLCLVGIAFAGGSGATVSLDSPASSQSYKPGDTVEIVGTVQNIEQVTILVRNAGGGIAYAAQPPVINGIFSTQFDLNEDAAEGQYSIRIGAKELAAPVDFTFKVGKSSSQPGGSGGGSGGATTPGVVTPTTGAATVTPSADGAISPGNEAAVEEPAGLTDTTLKDISGHWAADNISKLVALGAINGYPDGSFKPDNTITRAEFATMLVKAFKLENKGGKIFADTAAHWARDYIATTAANGIVSGYDDATFGPDDLITREQMAVMIIKVARLAPVAGEIQFADSGSISGWASEAMATATENGIIKGYPDNTVRPLGSATRAEAVTVIVNAMK